MINQELIKKVLKRAGKEEIEIEKPVKRYRYFFYDASPEYSIKFTHLTTILKGTSSEKDALIDKLKGGNSGKYCADYFRWRKVYVVTNQYSNDYVVYEASLNPIGTKVPGTEKLYPSNAESIVNIKDFEDDLSLYISKRGNSNVINLDVGESLFTDKEESKNFIKILLSGMAPSNFLNYQDFIKIFDEYRIWVPNLNILLLPDLNIPKTDDVKGGHYKGGIKSFEEFVAPYIKETKKEKKELSLKEKKELEEQSIFEPVDQQKKERVEGEYLDTKMASMVTKVMSNYLKDAGMLNMPGPVGPTNKSNLSKKLLEDAKKHEIIKKKLEETAKSIEEIGY
jgi:hypothetical protein